MSFSYLTPSQGSRESISQDLPFSYRTSTSSRLWTVKPTVDFFCAAAILVLASPLLLLAALLVKLTSRGPVLYCQVRIGRRGKPFLLYKVRTMAHDCEKESGIRWSGPGD